MCSDSDTRDDEMLKNFKGKWKKKIFQIRSFFIAKLSKFFLYMLIKTCRIKIEGMEQFSELITKEKCILMLWHNRIAITLLILAYYTPEIPYAALVSASRDGDILSYIIHSYKNGNTIRVPHLARYQALQEIIRHIEARKQFVVITPDGPRGPCYEIKPGIAIAALETEAHVISLNWEAKKYWELKTWDKLRLPKPFTTIYFTFGTPLRFDKQTKTSLEEAKTILKKKLP